VATLVYNPGEPDEKSFAIRHAAVTIGRAEDQGVCIPHKSLSRSHARIEPSAGRFFVVDLESKNGTLVNGVRVQRRELHHGDTITLGNLDLLFRVEPTHGSGGHVAAPEPQPQATRALLRGPIAKLARDSGLEREAAGRTQGRLRTLIEVTKLLPLSDDIDALLGKILDLVFQILDVDRGVILLVDEKTGELEPRAVKSAQDGPDGGSRGHVPTPDARPIFSQNIVQYVLRKSVAALFTDAGNDPRLDSARSVVVQSIRASMCVPLKPRDEVIGVLYVDSQRAVSLFSEDDLEFLLAFASQAAVAIENARLYRRLEQETVARMQLIMEAKLASLGTMVAAIAHELRNPLNFMTNFAELSVGLTDEVADSLSPHRAALPEGTQADLDDALANLRGNVSRIQEHGRRADAVIQGMLQHTRRPSGVREVADLNAVVAEGVRLAREGPQGKDMDVKVIEAYDRALAPMEMGRLDLGRVFLNVVENSLYALRQKKRERGAAHTPELRVTTADRGDHVEVRIRDNGTGIPKDAEGRIFEPFFTTKPTGQGTGLGLSLGHEIVVQGHQGTMRAESKTGEWAEIAITLPKSR
jgi:two-component system, NtrC family, sensor kinase